MIQAQAVWKGRYYSSRVCSNPNCKMCNSIQMQLQDSKKEQKSRQVTTYKTEYYTVKICHGRGKPCTYETRSRLVPYTKTVDESQPKEAPKKPDLLITEKQDARLTKTEYVPTPSKELLKLFNELYVPSDAIFYEVGCGEGDTLQYFHAQYSLKNSYGIELDRELAKKAVLNNPSSKILVGDARDFTYLNATHVYMYLYPELMDKVIDLLPKNTTIISYSHKLPESLSPRKIGNFYVATK